MHDPYDLDPYRPLSLQPPPTMPRPSNPDPEQLSEIRGFRTGRESSPSCRKKGELHQFRRASRFLDDFLQFGVRFCGGDILSKRVHVGTPNSLLERRYNVWERLGRSHAESLHLDFFRCHSYQSFSFDARVDYPLFFVLLHQHPLACVRRAVEDFRSLCLAGS
jgi:hypothetical protein